MAAISTYLADNLINHSLGVAAFTMPAATYLALMTTAPNQAGGGVEAAYTGYARVALAGLIGDAASNSAENTSAITFGECTAGSSTVVAFAVYDASSGGNLLWFGPCSDTISSGDTPTFATGTLDFTMN